ncbi:MAG: alcohol dehydrogenase catalytic domain-containing protein [Proteobacteria bacterium]|nr:alcohol dehydrogenase catalytic domain-containing protein [Pseudomonadota bacterium]
MFSGVRAAETVDVADPVLRSPTDVILSVERTAICGSDLHPYRGEWGDPGGQRPGHEFIGTIVEAGRDVRSRRRGERVLCSGAVGCGECPACAQGLSAACVSGMKVFGIPMMTDYPGGQAEYVAVPSADFSLLPIPEEVAPEAALLLTDNLATGWQAAQRAGVREGNSAVVVGFGPVGMCAAMSARELGAWDLFVIDPLGSRREFAASLGYRAFDATPEAEAEIVELTGGGADCVLETAGRDASMRSAVAVAHPSATISSVSVPSEPYSAEPSERRLPTQRFRSSVASPQRAWPQLIPRLGSPALARLAEIFSHRLPLARSAEAYALFSERPDECRKILFDLTL